MENKIELNLNGATLFYGDIRPFQRNELINDIEKLINSESSPELVEMIQLLERCLILLKEQS